jgi:hypothetical protein
VAKKPRYTPVKNPKTATNGGRSKDPEGTHNKGVTASLHPAQIKWLESERRKGETLGSPTKPRRGRPKSQSALAGRIDVRIDQTVVDWLTSIDPGSQPGVAAREILEAAYADRKAAPDARDG